MDKAESENQVIHGHQQERCAHADLDRAVYLFVNCLLEIPIKISAINAADTQSITNKSIRKMAP